MKLHSLYTGRPQNVIWGKMQIDTALIKEQVPNSLFLGRTNLEGDGQADLVHHGGEDKAVCVYPQEHYLYWEKELQTKLPEAVFGENFSVLGMEEAEVHIGDVFEVGEAVVQISQPREPCYKPAARLGIKELPQLIRENGFSGYYLRVLKEGTVAPGDKVTRTETGKARLTVAEANRIMYHHASSIEKTKALLQEKTLAESWRRPLGKRLAGLQKEMEVKE